ncbi:MAG TPA: hypothetical protein VKU60_19505 [Chloroflexota bacterium]|nr:hypothetical protein [Chloroflexota bacterium]
MIFARGVHHEKARPDGTLISGAGTDEIAIREQYRYWQQLMAAG